MRGYENADITVERVETAFSHFCLELLKIQKHLQTVFTYVRLYSFYIQCLMHYLQKYEAKILVAYNP